jgi:hypothetical protein
MIRLRHILVFAVACCLAQPSVGQGLESAASDAQRYIDCVDLLDAACLDELTYPGFSACSESAPQVYLFRLRDLFERARLIGDPDLAYWRIEAAAPVAIESADERMFALVPLRVLNRINLWSVSARFLLGVSENDGESWRFIEDGIVRETGIDRIVPGYAGPPLPELKWVTPDPQPALSRYLETREAGFVLGAEDGDAFVKLAFEVRRRIRKPLTLFVAFENPRVSAEPIVSNSVLMPGQASISVVSPLITGLSADQYYEVVVFGLDPETDEAIFEHRQMLRYVPAIDYYDEVVPAIAAPPNTYSMPIGGSTARNLPDPLFPPEAMPMSAQSSTARMPSGRSTATTVPTYGVANWGCPGN